MFLCHDFGPHHAEWFLSPPTLVPHDEKAPPRIVQLGPGTVQLLPFDHGMPDNGHRTYRAYATKDHHCPFHELVLEPSLDDRNDTMDRLNTYVLQGTWPPLGPVVTSGHRLMTQRRVRVRLRV